MSSHPVMTLIANRMRTFKNQLYRVLQKIPDRAPLSNVAKALDGRTSTQVIAELNTIVATHTNKVNQNIHNETPELLGTYPTDYINEWANELVGYSDRYPLSFYGNREYLPPDISGSFGNATNPLPYSGVAMMLEDNGTLVMLRPGTDGAVRNVYYAYVPNAMSTFSVADWVVTSLPYRPAFIPNGMRVHTILNGSRETLLGTVCTLDGTRTGYFLAITNSTFDMSKHSGVYIPNGSFPNITFDLTQNTAVASFLLGSHVYILISAFTSGTNNARDTCGFAVKRVPITSVLSGTITGMEDVTGWTINRGVAGQVSRPDLIIADHVTDVCSVASFVGYVSQNPRTATEAIWTYPSDNGNQIVSFSCSLTFSSANGNNQADAPFVFSFEFNPVTKVVDVSRYFNSKTVVSGTASTITFASSAAVSSSAIRTLLKGRKQVYVHVADNKSVWVYNIGNDTSQDAKYTRLLYSGSSTWDQVLSFTGYPIGNTSFLGLAKPGGPLGTNFHALGVLSENVITTLTLTKRENYLAPEWTYVRCVIEGSPNYQHASATGDYVMTGYPPTDNRAFIGTSAGSNSFLARSFTTGVAEVVNGTLLVHGGTFHNYSTASAYWGTMLNRPAHIDANGNGSGSIAVSSGVISLLKGQIAWYFGLRKHYPYGSQTTGIMMSLCVPILADDIPPFVYGLFITDKGFPCWFVFSVYLPPGMSRSNMTPHPDLQIMCPPPPEKEPDPDEPEPDPDEEEEPEPEPLFAPSYYHDEIYEYSGGIHRSVTYIHEFGSQNAIRKSSSGTYQIVLNHPGFVSTVAGSQGVISSIRYEPYNQSWGVYQHAEFQPTGTPVGALNFPQKGLYLAMSSEGQYGNIDYGSKLIGRLWITTGLPMHSIQDMIGYLAQKGGNTSTVLMSQQVPTSWTLFFNRPVPVVLRGISGTLPAYRHYFVPSTDTNKTFNVWACSDSFGGAPYYRVLPVGSLPFQPDITENKFFLFLGVVTTNNVGIANIQIGKPAAIGPYLISQDKRGSSIPYSAGLPSETNPLRWR